MISIEELLPVMAHLADKYTSKESTSVSYDTAQRLMEAVLYCIHECDSEKQGRLLEGTRLSSETLMRRDIGSLMKRSSVQRRYTIS